MMSTPRDDRSDQPRSVTRRGALGRLLGLAGAATVAAALPAVAEAQPVAPIGATREPTTVAVLPDWLRDRPDWLVANVERYARALATLADPLAPWGESLAPTREGGVLRWTEATIRSMNETDAERAARDRRWRDEWASTPREVAQGRIVTVRIPRLDRNERARLRRWLARLPAGERDPRVVYRLGWRDRAHGQRDSDFLHVVAPTRRSIACPSPREHAEAVVGAMFGGGRGSASSGASSSATSARTSRRANPGRGRGCTSGSWARSRPTASGAAPRTWPERP